MKQYLCPTCKTKLKYKQEACFKCATQFKWEGIEENPRSAKGRKSPLKVVGGILGGLLVLVLGFILFPGGDEGGQTREVSLGVIEHQAVEKVDLIETQEYGVVAANQVVMMLQDGLKKTSAEKVAQAVDGEVVGHLEFINLYQVKVQASNEKELNEVIADLEGSEGVEWASPNSLAALKNFTGETCESAKLFDEEVFDRNKVSQIYESIGLWDAYRILKATKTPLNPVHVGIADTWVNLAMEALYDANISGDAHMFLDAHPQTGGEKVIFNPHNNHGTRVAQILAANPSGGKIVGVASILGSKMRITSVNMFKMEKMDALRLGEVDQPGSRSTEAQVTVHEGGGTIYRWDPSSIFGENAQEKMAENVEEMNEAFLERHSKEDESQDFMGTMVELSHLIEKGASIINCSFGVVSLGEYEKLCLAYDKYLNKLLKEHPQVLIVAAAGNQNLGINGSNDFWGKKVGNLITVGAVDSQGNKADLSNYAVGDGEVTLAAPGVGIPTWGAVVRNKFYFEKQSGTSYSTPMVTGAAAIVRAIDPKLSASEIKSLLVKTANKEVAGTFDSRLGSGVLRVDEAVLLAINGLREKEGLDPLTMEDVLELGKIHLVAVQGEESFNVSAEIKSVLAKETLVEITVEGDHVLAGDTTQTLSGPGTVSWKLDLQEEPVTLTVVRKDSEACATLTLTNAAQGMAGVWTGGTDEKDVLPLGLVIEEVNGTYQATAELFPEVVFGELSETIDEGYYQGLVVDYNYMKGFMKDVLNPQFSNLVVTEDAISFDLVINRMDDSSMYIKVNKATIQFAGSLGPDGLISGEAHDLLAQKTYKWYMKKGSDGIILDKNKDDIVFKGFWQ